MANLQFKMGLLNDLNNPSKAPITPGTVYITTDEKSMYVDINDSQRIRVGGSIIYCETLTEFQNKVKPPYSTDLIYFIEKNTAQSTSRINVLARWNGTQWDILNVNRVEFDNFVENFDELKEIVVGKDEKSGLRKQVQENTGKLAELVDVPNAVENLQKLIGTPTDEDLKNTILVRLSNSEEALEKVDKALPKLDKAVFGDEKTNTIGLVEDVGILKGIVGNKNDAITENTLYGEINQINSKIGNKADKIEKPEEFDGASLYARTNWNKAQIDNVIISFKDLEDKLGGKIDKEINAANAMNYKGSVATLEELNTLSSRNDLSKGDTYVIAGNFSDDIRTYHAGDLIIANGTENDEGVITSNLAWDLVETGYQETHEAQLSLSNNIILLSSDVNSDLGKIKIISDNLNITSDSGKATPELKINMEWGTF